MNILDQLVVVPAPLKPLPALSQPTNEEFLLGDTVSSRPLEIGVWMVCQTTPIQAGSRWTDLCSRLSERGLLVECGVAALDKLPVASVPRRLFRQTIGSGLNVEELQSADVVEITCQNSQSNAWGWPPELESTEEMGNWIEAVKQVIGTTPVGLGVHAGVSPTTIESLLDWPIDFITLHTDGTSELLINSLARLRIMQTKLGLKRPILVRGPIGRVDHLIKILMLGASAISIDSYLQDLWKSNSISTANSFLGTKLQTSSSVVKCPISERLDALRANWNTCTQSCPTEGRGIDTYSAMRALTPAAARLAGLAMLGEAT